MANQQPSIYFLYILYNDRYRTLVRTSFRLSILGNFVATIFNEYEWKHCAIIWDDLGAYWPRLGPSVRDILIENEVKVVDIPLTSHDTILEALEEAAAKARSK